MFEITDNELNELREKYIGQFMVVEALADKLPRLWVAMKVVERDPDDNLIVLSGRILEIVKDGEARQLRSKYRGNRDVYVLRTTCEMNVG